jgi:hypothetical protein
MFQTRGQATTRTPTTRAPATGRSRSVLLILALLGALGAPLAGALPAAAQADVRLELTPTMALTEVKKPVRYSAYLVDANHQRADVTDRTTLSFASLAPCHQDSIAGQVSCDDNGSFRIIGVLDDPKIISEPVELQVVNRRVPPLFGSPPTPSPPNREVVVRGLTGSCSQDGTLSSTQLQVDQQVTGSFTATFKIPPGTFPGRYPLSLAVTCDGQREETTVDITVSNRPPDAVDDHATTTSGESVPIDVTKNDTDPDGDDGYATVLEVDPPTVGTADVQGQAIIYTPGVGFVDRDQFTYRNCDVVDASGKARNCDSAAVAVAKRDPVPKADQAVTKQGKAISILVTGNDTSPDPATMRVRTNPKHGTAVVQQRPRDGHIIYAPQDGLADTDTFTYDYCDGVVVGPNVAARDACPFATVTVTVEPDPPEPEAVDDPNEHTERDKQVDLEVMNNDRHPDAARLQVLSDPAPHGMAVAQPNGAIRYAPRPGATGKDSFRYNYCKPVINLTASAACAPATVTVVIRPPVEITRIAANPTPPNKDVEVTGTTGFCQEGTLRLRIPPDKDVPVAVTADQDGTFTARLKVPGGTSVGPYGLVLGVNCGGQARGAQGKLVVVNKAPDAVDDAASTAKDTPVVIDVTANDTDPDGDDGYQTSLEAAQPASGTTEVLSGNRVRYTPNAGFTGDDPFTYRFCDIVDANGRRDCHSATVSVTVTDEPLPVDDPDETTVQDRPVSILVTSNDLNPDPARLRVRTDPKEGTAVVQERPRDGHILYTPGKGFAGNDSFKYGYCPPPVNLRSGADCRLATVTVKVRPAPVPPVIKTVAANPTPPNKEVVVSGTTGSCSQAGTLILHIPAPGSDVSVPVIGAQDGAFEQRLKVPRGTFVGAYRLELRVDCQGKLQADEDTLVVANQPPDAVDDPASTPERTPVAIDVTGNDTDPDGDDGYATSLEVAQPASGTTEVLSGDRVLYTPKDGFTGMDRFTYTLCEIVDAKGGKDCGTATVTVTGRRRPVPVDDPDKTTPRDQPVVIDVMGNDRDPDASLLQVKPPARPGAKAEKQPDGTIRYTPEAGVTGTDTFTYDYCGGSVDVTAVGNCPSATVTVTVTDTQILPVISSIQPSSTPPGKPIKVSGSTGSCSRVGTLALQGTAVAVTVTGNQDGAFTTRLTVPAGTFPGPYILELGVDCNGQLQRVEARLTVTNQAPVAADDVASTPRDQAKAIRVTANDHDPDDPDGHRTLVLITGPPGHGTAEVQLDLTVVYTPQPSFVGTDRFAYSLCDDVLNPAGHADCGTATVTITVTKTKTKRPVISLVAPGSTSPGKPVEVIGNTGSCGRAGTLTLSGAAGFRRNVTGDQDGRFAVTITVPEGTFPRVYTLELGVDCKGQLQRAEAQLTVANQAPMAADDQATTTPGTATTIDVTGNDHDPDDPDTYRTIVLVTRSPDHGTAEAQPDQSILYTPGPGFVGTDRFEYGLCDDVVNAAGQADCGAATVTVRVDPLPCLPSERDHPSLRLEPKQGSGGTRLRITAAVDPRLATCQLRLLLGGTPLAPDVTVGDDGSIAAERGVPSGLKPGPNLMRLATMTAQTLAETPFEVVGPPPPPPSWLVRLLLTGGALAAGFLARAAFRRWKKPDGDEDTDRRVEQPDAIRAEPHSRPVEVTVEPVPDTTRTLAVRLEPHPDPGIQTIQPWKK